MLPLDVAYQDVQAAQDRFVKAARMRQKEEGYERHETRAAYESALASLVAAFDQLAMRKARA